MDTTINSFQIEIENGNIKNANLLSVFSKNDIEYAVYSIENEDNEMLYASRIVKDEEGHDSLVNISDETERKEIIDLIKDILKN